MSRRIYLCLLLTALIIQQGYKTKTQMQQLSEGNVIQKTGISKKTNKKNNKNKKDKKSKAPLKTEQQQLKTHPKEPFVRRTKCTSHRHFTARTAAEKRYFVRYRICSVMK